jgi:hypothetical protein
MHVHSQFKNSQITWTEKWGPPNFSNNVFVGEKFVGDNSTSRWRASLESMTCSREGGVADFDDEDDD